jgi:hypothetical protein
MWAIPARSLEVTIHAAAAGRALVARRLVTSPTPTGQVTVRLDPVTVPRGTRIAVCIRNTGPGKVTFEGGPANSRSGRLTVAGQPSSEAIALRFVRPHPPSLLSLLPTVFDRASLFKLSWVGAWSFWLLAGALIVAFGVAGKALVAAVQADGADEERP